MIFVYPPLARPHQAASPASFDRAQNSLAANEHDGEAFVRDVANLGGRVPAPLETYRAQDPAQVVLALREPNAADLRLASLVLGRAGHPWELFVGPRWCAAWLPHPGAAPAATAEGVKERTAWLRAALRAGARLQWLAGPGADSPPPHVHQAVLQLAEKGRGTHFRWVLHPDGVRRAMNPAGASALPVTHHDAGAACAVAPTLVVQAGIDEARSYAAVHAALVQFGNAPQVVVLGRRAQAPRAFALLASPRLLFWPRRGHETAGEQWARALAELPDGEVTYVPAGCVLRRDAVLRLQAAAASHAAELVLADQTWVGPGAQQVGEPFGATLLPRPPGAPPQVVVRLTPDVPRGGTRAPLARTPRVAHLAAAGPVYSTVAAWRSCAARLAATATLGPAALLANLCPAATVAYVATPLSDTFVPAGPEAAQQAAAQELAAAQQAAAAATRALATAQRSLREVREGTQLRLQLQAEAARAQCGTLAARNAELEDALARLTASSSWKVTQPARQVKAGLERVGLRFGLGAGLRRALHAGDEGP